MLLVTDIVDDPVAVFKNDLLLVTVTVAEPVPVADPVAVARNDLVGEREPVADPVEE